MTTATPQDILNFWYGDDVTGGSWQEKAATWFSSNDELDAEIQHRFGDAFAAAADDELRTWTDSAESLAALIILLDQFSRNIHRNSPQAFANDGKALALSQEGVLRGYDQALLPIQRLFLYMPMMHAEDLQVQLNGLALFRALADEPSDAQSFLEGSVNSAVEHMEIIERFGRFPHRNVILGRQSTPEEVAYMAAGGATFGQAAPTDPSTLEESANPELYD